MYILKTPRAAKTAVTDKSAIVLRFLSGLKLKSGYTDFIAFEHIHVENYTRV